jgi:hypothetical protein
MLCALIFTKRNGFHLFTLFNNYAAYQSLFLVLMLEIVVIVYILGIDKLDALMQRRTGEKFPKWAKISVKFITPILVGFLLISSLINEFKADYEGTPYWAKFLSRFLIFFPIACCFIGLIKPMKSPSFEELVKD